MSAFIFDQSLLRVIKLPIHLHQSHNQMWSYGYCTTENLTSCLHMFQLHANGRVTFNDLQSHLVICADHFYLGLFFLILPLFPCGMIVGSYEISIQFLFPILPYFLVGWHCEDCWIL